MSLSKKKDSPYWYTRFTILGHRVQESTRCTSKAEAQRYEDKRKREIREALILGDKKKPNRTWLEAEKRWLDEMEHKRSIETDIIHFGWLEEHLGGYNLCDITKHVIEELAAIKEREGSKPGTINRVLDLVRAVLNRAHRVWEWIDKVPVVQRRHVDDARVRWLTHGEARRLLEFLPPHLEAMARFTLATGLRAGNVRKLEWSQINMQNRNVTIHADQSKNGRPFGVPLNEDAIEVLKGELGKSHRFVFTYQGHPVNQCCTKAWWKALAKAGIKNFRWHDLRHTWASWHVQNGTSLQELFELGGWKTFSMVLRYAHLSSSHLEIAAKRVSGADMVRSGLKVVK